MTNENPRGLPVVERVARAMQASEQAAAGWSWEDCSPIEVEGWMELAQAAVLATDYAALLAERDELQSAYAAMTRQAEHHMLEQDKAEARAERLAEALRFTRHRFAPYMDNADLAAIDAAISAMEGRE